MYKYPAVYNESHVAMNPPHTFRALLVIGMPLGVSDVHWEENEEQIVVQLPLNGVKANKVDIYSNDLFIKVWQIRGGMDSLNL